MTRLPSLLAAAALCAASAPSADDPWRFSVQTGAPIDDAGIFPAPGASDPGWFARAWAMFNDTTSSFRLSNGASFVLCKAAVSAADGTAVRRISTEDQIHTSKRWDYAGCSSRPRRREFVLSWQGETSWRLNGATAMAPGSTASSRFAQGYSVTSGPPALPGGGDAIHSDFDFGQVSLVGSSALAAQGSYGYDGQAAFPITFDWVSGQRWYANGVTLSHPRQVAVIDSGVGTAVSARFTCTGHADVSVVNAMPDARASSGAYVGYSEFQLGGR